MSISRNFCRALIIFLTLVFIIQLSAQVYQKPDKPMKYWNSAELKAYWENQRILSLKKPTASADRREGIMSGNAIRTVFYNYGSVGKPNWEPSIEWPKFSGHGYAYEFCPIIGPEVQCELGRG